MTVTLGFLGLNRRKNIKKFQPGKRWTAMYGNFLVIAEE
jgi:hypothetical protein